MPGSSLRVDSARIAANPPTLIGVMAASEPPAIIAIASPRRMISNDSPTAWADAEQAVQVARFGPLAPNRIDTWPAARLMIADGMKKGEILRGPPWSRAMCSRSIVMNPPMPDPMNAPTSGRVLVGDRQLRIVHRELGRRDGVLDEEVHLLDLLLLNPVERIEPTDFGGDLRRVSRDVELGNPRHARCARHQIRPVGVGPDAQR